MLLRVLIAIRGAELSYHVEKRELALLGKTAPLEPVAGKIQLQILVDRCSIEVFANGGLVSMSSCFLPRPDDKSLALVGPGAKVERLDVWELKSAWSDGP